MCVCAHVHARVRVCMHACMCKNSKFLRNNEFTKICQLSFMTVLKFNYSNQRLKVLKMLIIKCHKMAKNRKQLPAHSQNTGIGTNNTDFGKAILYEVMFRELKRHTPQLETVALSLEVGFHVQNSDSFKGEAGWCFYCHKDIVRPLLQRLETKN